MRDKIKNTFTQGQLYQADNCMYFVPNAGSTRDIETSDLTMWVWTITLKAQEHRDKKNSFECHLRSQLRN